MKIENPTRIKRNRIIPEEEMRTDLHFASLPRPDTFADYCDEIW